MENRKLALVIIAVACALCFALVGCGGSPSASSEPPSSSATPYAANFVGEWEVYELDARSHEDVVLAQKEVGYYMNLTINADGTGTLNYGKTGESKSVDEVWEASSETEMYLKAADDICKGTLTDGKLHLTRVDATFVKKGTA